MALSHVECVYAILVIYRPVLIRSIYGSAQTGKTCVMLHVKDDGLAWHLLITVGAVILELCKIIGDRLVVAGRVSCASA